MRSAELGFKKGGFAMEDNRCPECGAPLHYIYAENIWVCPRCDVEDPPKEETGEQIEKRRICNEEQDME